MSGFPYIFTFYSYKGGVGRSMALLNVAYRLAGWGKHVLVLDLDLEAPGISAFLKRQDEFAPAEGAHPLDVLSLLGQVVSAVRDGESATRIAEQLPPLSHYLRRVAPEKLAPLAPKLGSLGRLDIVAADMDRDWCRRLAELGLQGLTQDKLAEVSRALHFYLKAWRFPHREVGMEDFDPPLSTPYDYILIDSRTGITEVGGLCVGPLADRLIVFSALNDQNVEGTLTFLEAAGITPARRAPDSDPWDEADNPAAVETPTLGPKPTLLVASPVPNGEIDFKKKRLAALQEKIGIRPLRLSYHPQIALMESVFVRDHHDEYLAREYAELAEAMTALVGDHPGQIVRRATRLLQDEKAPAKAAVEVLRLISQNPDLGVSWLTRLGDAFDPKEEEDFLVARRLHANVAKISEFEAVALNNWGNMLLAQARRNEDEKAEWLLVAACGRYARAVELTPNDHEVLNNWGNALFEQAKRKEGTEAASFVAEACAKYARAVELDSNCHAALNGWGVAIYWMAEREEKKTAIRLFAEACSKYARAVELKPDGYEVLNNWGNALLAQAQRNGGEVAELLFAEACGKYARAVELKRDFDDALSNWGGALIVQAGYKSPPESDHLLSEARQKLEAAEAVKPGAGAYNLACLAALRGDVDEAVSWLRSLSSGAARRKTGIPLIARRIAADQDFDAIRVDPVFRAFVGSLPAK